MSCGIAISAYRSLAREFSGFMIRKTSAVGAVSTQYWLFLLPDSELSSKSGEAAVISALTPDQQQAFSGDLHRVGVSAIVFNEADSLSRIEKSAYSLVIKINNQSYVDLGVNWLVFALAGILLSVWMYFQTLRQLPGKSEPEDLDI